MKQRDSLSLTTQTLREQLDLIAKASAWPWVATYYDDRVTANPGWQVDCSPPDILSVATVHQGFGGDGEAEANARMIAASRTGWPAAIATALAERQRAEKAEAALRAILRAYDEPQPSWWDTAKQMADKALDALEGR